MTHIRRRQSYQTVAGRPSREERLPSVLLVRRVFNLKFGQGAPVKLPLIPLAAPIVFVVVIAFLIHWMVRSMRRNVRLSLEDFGGGKEVHIRAPIGTLDVQPHAKLGHDLAQIPLYPGAIPLADGVAEYEADVRLLNREFHLITANYWTPTPPEIVLDFYRRELQGWTESRLDHSFTHDAGECVRKVRISAKSDRTLIEIGVRPAAKGAGA